MLVPNGFDGEPLGVGGAASRLAPRRAPALGLPLGSGTGNELDDADGVAEPDGDALLCTPHNVLTTGLGDAEELVDGDDEDDGRVGRPDGLCDGSADGLGPPSSLAKAVAATEPNAATAATLIATDFERTADFRVIRGTSVHRALPDRHSGETDIGREKASISLQRVLSGPGMLLLRVTRDDAALAPWRAA